VLPPSEGGGGTVIGPKGSLLLGRAEQSLCEVLAKKKIKSKKKLEPL